MSNSPTELIALLQDCIHHLECSSSSSNDKNDDAFSPILYQTMAALHAYTGRQIGLPVVSPTRASFQKMTHMNDVVASGWMEEMANSSTHKSKQVTWKPVLALLVQKDKEEPCMWITREILDAGLEPELETMHRIPMRRLQSVEYVDFYGDHRFALNIKRKEIDLIFRCQDSTSAQSWVQQLEKAKMKGRASRSVAIDESVELEMDEGHIVNLAQDSDENLPEEHEQFEAKGLSDRLQEGDDLRRIHEEEEQAEDLRRLKEEQERLVQRVKEEQEGEAQRVKEEEERKAQRIKEEEAQEAQRVKEEEERETQRVKEEQEKAAREAQQQKEEQVRAAQRQKEEQERAAQRQKEEQERAARETQRVEEEQEKTAREAQRQKEDQERAAQRQKEEQERAARETQRVKEEQEKAAREAQQQKEEQERAAQRQKEEQEEAAREKQRVKEDQERAAREAHEWASHEQQRRKEQETQSFRQMEEDKHRLEYELEQQKKVAEKKRQQDLAQQRRVAHEEQKKLELEEKRKFLLTEQRKQDLVAKAKAVKAHPSSSALVNAGVMDKVNSQIFALDAVDAERKRIEEAKKKEEEEKKKQSKQQVDTEDPEAASKRIAEDACQRIALSDAERKLKRERQEKEAGVEHQRKQAEEQARLQQQHVAAEATRQQQAQAWAEQQRRQASAQQPSNVYGTASQSQYPHHPVPPQAQPQHQWKNAQQQAWDQWHQQNQQAPPQTQQQQLHQQQYAQRAPLPGQVPGHYVQQQQQSFPSHQPSVQQTHSFGRQQTYPHQQHPQQGSFPETATAPLHPGRHSAQPQAAPHHPPTGVDMKYKQMAQQAQDEASSTTALKRNILIQWALQPPAMQILRSIDQLLCNIQSVYPPSFGVAAHSYFVGFQAILRADVTNANGVLEEDKLKRAVKKVRFFLHPDKLPRDLTEEQQFMCKLLWDVTNDAWEDYKKSQEELDWVG